MNKVITINLNGVAYQLEEGGYDALRAYLENAARRLEGNPDKDEIITDIEQAIADKFRALLGAYKTVVNAKEVAAVLEEMGPVQDDTDAGPAKAAAEAGRAQETPRGAGETSAPGGSPKRLYRITEGAMLTGVCNGLAAYVNIDVTLVRLAFTLLTFLWGAGVLVYLVLAVIVPAATTPTEKAAASGAAATAQEFIKRAREGYYEGMRSFHDRHARREWKRKFKRDMRSWKYGFRAQMQEQAPQASPHWQSHWAQQPAGIVGPVFIAPLLSILLFGLVCVMIYAIYSLAKYHVVFGLALPATMPVWVGILLVIFAYMLVAWPIKSLRWACYYPGPYHDWGGPFGGLLGSLIGLFFLAFGIWSLNRHVPEFHEWLVQLPGLLHRLVDTVSGWFASKP